MRGAARSGLLALLLGSCGGERAEPPWRVRLWEAPGVLTTPAPDAPRVLVAEDFARRPEGWHVLTDQRAVLAVEGEALRLEPGREGEREYLTLGGSGGSLYTLVEVEPDTTYAFRGTLRARGVEPEGEEFHGATFWVGEFSRRGTPAELFAGGGWVDRTHAIASAHGEDGWRERAFVFRTLPSTKALALGCILSVNEPLKAGAVDFDRLELAQVDEREHWEYEAARAVAEQHRGEAPFPAGDWRARRSVGAMFGFEQRPAILLLPGDALELELHAPRGDLKFRMGLGLWPPASRAGGSRLLLDLEGEAWHDEDVVALGPRDSLDEQTWQAFSGTLPPGLGDTFRLKLRCEGDLPLVLGAPELVGDAPPQRRPNVVLVSIDTLRADRVGAYGATSGATPQLDALAAEALLFQDMTANAPYTLPAHASLFSGQFPRVHGVEDKGRVLATTRSPVLARTLGAHGYRTAAFTSAVFLTPEFGFAQGFDGFTTIDPFRHEDSRFFEELATTRPEQELTDERRRAGLAPVFTWLERHRAEPFFLFLHTYEVHDYDPPRAEEPCPVEGCGIAALDYREFLLKKNRREPFPGTERERAHIGHLYDQALRHVDTGVGRLLAELARLGLEDETLVVVTSDHGEELFERGHLQHGKSLQGEQLSIPLILRVPGEAPRRVATPAMQVDLVPTLLARLGLPADVRVQGVDLLARVAPRPLWSEVNDAFAHQSSVRDGGWKLLHAPRGAEVVFPAAFEWRLFDLARDPGELEDLAAREPARRAALQELHGRFAAELETRATELGPLGDAEALDEAMQKLLDDMGYGGH